ncbi:MAG: transcription-repair coupling factor, partial [Chloroflexi bacterium]|nr:transcription-repair coupling factor [Chloroflexota bacterium]MBI3733318.1 transcription-repair coupling factor [Chloroflexota bacterium]
LRGRVGRSARQAYAYLLYSRDKVLVDIVRRRLQAIFEASDLGAGFKIAMRDLEIRGAGDILGARQHGHIASIGFDLYTKLLAQAVRARQQSAGGDQRVDSQETPDVDATVTIDLPLEAHLPKDYVPDADLRLRLYRRMAGLNTVEAVEELRQELADRFGPLPEPVLNILHLLRLKALALRAGIDSITAETERIVLHARERRVLIGWRPPSDLERGVTVGRITLTLDIEENGGQGSQASLLALERLLAALSA